MFECAVQLPEFKDHLRTQFGIKDLGEPDVYLGMEVSRDKDKREIYLRHDLPATFSTLGTSCFSCEVNPARRRTRSSSRFV